MGATAVYRYIMTVGTVAIDADACGGRADYAWMTPGNGRKLTETGSKAGIVGFYTVIV
jgi:hypothetical protein